MGKPAYTESQIIEGCCRGDIRFQEMLYRMFYGFGMSVCLRYHPQRSDALELLNDSFMKVFENISRFDKEKPFRSWFRRILVNTCLDRYRENKRFQILTEWDEEEVRVEARFTEKMDAEEILVMLSELPEIYRLIFNLYEVEGYSHDEIAGMLQIAPGTSRSHLSRAKSLLRKAYHKKLNKPYHEAI